MKLSKVILTYILLLIAELIFVIDIKNLSFILVVRERQFGLFMDV